MDPNIMKILEDDEDDGMHSGADVEAFAAALNRDIEGDTSQQPFQSRAGAVPQESNSTSNQFTQEKDSNREKTSAENEDAQLKNSQHHEQSLPVIDMIQHGSGSENQEQQVDCTQEHSPLQLEQKDDQLQQQAEENPHQKSSVQTSERNLTHLNDQDKMHPPEHDDQFSKLQKTNNQQTQAGESENRNKQVSFGMLLPVIIPHLDKDRSMQLQTLYAKLRKNEIQKDGFVRHMRTIVGDQMLRQAVHKLQMQQTKTQAAQNSQTSSHQLQALPQTSSQQQQQVQMPSLSALQFTDSHPLQLHQKGHRASTDPQVPTSMVEVQSDSSVLTKDRNAIKKESDHQSDSPGMHVNQVSSSMGAVPQEKDMPVIHGLNKKQQLPLHLAHTSYPMYGANMSNYHAHPYSGQSIGTSSTSLKSQTPDSQIRQAPHHQGMVPTQSGGIVPTQSGGMVQTQSSGMVHTQPGGTTQPMSSIGLQNYELQNSSNESKRMHGVSFSHLPTQSTLQHNPVSWQSSLGKDIKGSSLASMPCIKQEVGQIQEEHISQIPSSSSSTSFAGKFDRGNPVPPGANSVSVSIPTQLDSLGTVHTQVMPTATSLGPGNNIKTPPRKPSIGQKKPLDAVGISSALTSKKQKVSGGFLDQSIEQLNDVTSVSGVDLREEEEQLFSGPKEESRASEATRRVLQEEEERIILQKIPLQKKMAKIMSTCGIKNVSKDVERCLSLCLEERMRGIISNTIRVSKQRIDIERLRHRTIITSDVKRQILVMNRTAKEDWEKKQAEEAEKLRKINEVDGNSGADGEKDKDDGRTKTGKANKDVDDKMKTTAANVAARVAVGGDDMLSKWQLMAEQARQKREGGDSTSAVQTGKDVTRKPSSTSGRMSKETPEGSTRKFGRNTSVMPHNKVVRTISVKDVIAVLEREPQMSKSTLIFGLYDKMREQIPHPQPNEL